MKDPPNPLSARDDAWLLGRVARHDRAAFEELYRRTSAWLVVRLRRRCHDDDLVAEVMQDTYLAVWRAADTFAGVRRNGSVEGWLWTIAARRLVDAFRRRGRAAEPPPLSAAPGPSPAADSDALHPLLGGELAGAFAGLAPELREVLRATVLDGLSVRETAVLLGLPEGTVKTRARRARTVLRKALG